MSKRVVILSSVLICSTTLGILYCFLHTDIVQTYDLAGEHFAEVAWTEKGLMVCMPSGIVRYPWPMVTDTIAESNLLLPADRFTNSSLQHRKIVASLNGKSALLLYQVDKTNRLMQLDFVKSTIVADTELGQAEFTDDIWFDPFDIGILENCETIIVRQPDEDGCRFLSKDTLDTIGYYKFGQARVSSTNEGNHKIRPGFGYYEMTIWNKSDTLILGVLREVIRINTSTGVVEWIAEIPSPGMSINCMEVDSVSRTILVGTGNDLILISIDTGDILTKLPVNSNPASITFNSKTQEYLIPMRRALIPILGSSTDGKIARYSKDLKYLGSYTLGKHYVDRIFLDPISNGQIGYDKCGKKLIYYPE